MQPTSSGAGIVTKSGDITFWCTDKRKCGEKIVSNLAGSSSLCLGFLGLPEAVQLLLGLPHTPSGLYPYGGLAGVPPLTPSYLFPLPLHLKHHDDLSLKASHLVISAHLATMSIIHMTMCLLAAMLCLPHYLD